MYCIMQLLSNMIIAKYFNYWVSLQSIAKLGASLQYFHKFLKYIVQYFALLHQVLHHAFTLQHDNCKCIL